MTGTMQETQLPGWIGQGWQDMYGQMTRASYEMPGPYTGQRVADLTPEQRNLIQQLYNNVGSTNAGYNQALGYTNALAGFTSPNVGVQRLGGMDLSAYMNPFSQSIINPSLTLMDQSLAQQQNATAAQARNVGAFGGSRQGVAEGVAEAQTNLLKGQLGANLWSQNFLNAQQQAVGDINRQYTADVGNRAANQWDAGFRAQMANQLAGLTSARQAAFLAGVQPAMGGQAMLTQQEQAQLDAQKALYEEQRMDPVNRIMLRANMLKMAPYGTTSYSQSPAGSTNPLLTGLGTAATTAGLLGQFGMFKGYDPG